MIYEIDSAPVNGRDDWRHQVMPVQPQGKREEQMVGIAQRFIVVGQAMPPDIEVTGWIEATGEDATEACSDLIEQALAFQQMQADTELHTVTVHDVDFDNMILEEFGTTTKPMGFRNGDLESGQVGVKQGVRFRWRQTKFV